MEKDNYDSLFKYIIIGNTSCGKTCLLHYFLEGKFKRNSTYTIGVEFGSKLVQLGKKNIKLQIWDTAGQERFKAVARTYYRGALGAIILYDITSADSFDAVASWIKDAREMGRSDISIIVCGNKSDLQSARAVQFTDASRFCEQQGVMFVETSAATGDNVNEAFTTLTKKILELIEKGCIDQTELKPRLYYNNNAKLRDIEKEKQQENAQNQGRGCFCGGGGNKGNAPPAPTKSQTTNDSSTTSHQN